MLSALGDAVHVLPVANALRRTWPKTRITWVLQPGPHALVAGHPAIDEFVVFRRRRGWSAWQSYKELQRVMRGRHFDLLLGLQVYLKAGLIAAVVPARVKLGFDRARARDAQWLFTNRRIPPRAPQHVQDQYFEFLEDLGGDPRPVTWTLALPEREREEQRAFFTKLDCAACAVVVGTSRPDKNWDPTGYARTLERVENEYGLRPLLVGGPSATERALADRVLAETRATVLDTLGDDVRRLVWLLEGSALVISPDTGPLHIARAVGTPVIGLYGRTNPKRSGPYGAYVDLVVDGYADYPGEEYSSTPVYRNGMARVTVDAVMEKADLAMRTYVRGRGGSAR
jgi:heptosyltransferase I